MSASSRRGVPPESVQREGSTANGRELVAAIESVMQDASWFGRSIVEKLAQMRRPSDPCAEPASLAELTPRERQVLAGLGEGLSDPEIASELEVSRNTVRNHVSAIYAKIGVSRRGAAVVWAREHGALGRGERGCGALCLRPVRGAAGVSSTAALHSRCDLPIDTR